jgi:hypothetical protein
MNSDPKGPKEIARGWNEETASNLAELNLIQLDKMEVPIEVRWIPK